MDGIHAAFQNIVREMSSGTPNMEFDSNALEGIVAALKADGYTDEDIDGLLADEENSSAVDGTATNETGLPEDLSTANTGNHLENEDEVDDPEMESFYDMELDGDVDPDFEAAIAHLSSQMPELKFLLHEGEGFNVKATGPKSSLDAFNKWYDGDDNAFAGTALEGRVIKPFEKGADYWKAKYLALKEQGAAPVTEAAVAEAQSPEGGVDKPINTLAKLIGSRRF